MEISLIASSIRPQHWPAFLESLNSTTVEYEVVFAGPSYQDKPGIKVTQPLISSDGYIKYFHYIKTANIKPAQCYEIARREAIGETICYVADDCEFHNDIIGKAYKYWKSKDNYKLILSIQTKESGYKTKMGACFDMTQHRFFGYDKNTPLMAPLGLMSRKFLEEIGGFDRRYICGQYENNCVMMAYERGATVEIFGDENNFIEIDHIKKAMDIGEIKNEEDFLNRSFATGYKHDRKTLENSWTILDPEWLKKLNTQTTPTVKHVNIKKVLNKMIDKFEPYEDKDILTVSQSFKGKWL